MANRFVVISFDEMKERCPDSEYVDDYDGEERSYLLDSKHNEIVGSDGWQWECPEDMYFSRHLGRYVELLNQVDQEKQ